MTSAVAVPYTFLPLRFFLPELVVRLRAELGATIPIVGVVDGLLQIDLPSPAPENSSSPELSVWDVVGFTDLVVSFDGARLVVEGVLDVLPGYEPQFRIPGFDKLSIVVNQLGVIRVELDAEGAQLAVTGPSVALRFDPAWLRPVAADAPNAFAEIELVELGYLTLDSRGNIDFGAVPGGQLRFVTNNDPWRIGDSSVTLETGELDVILRDGPEGGPAITLTDAVLRFSQDLAAKDGSGFELALAGARIDRTGFTGTVSARFPDTAVDDPLNPKTFLGSGAASLFGFEFGVNSIDLEFRCNSPVRCAIAGGLILPFFEEAVSCTLALSDKGDFRVAFADVDGDGLVQFTKPEVCRLALTAFDLSRAEGVTTLSLSGDIEMLRAPGELGTVPKLTIKDLTIDSRGRVSLKAGWLELNPALTFDFIGFLLTIQRLGIGFDPSTLWVGVTGGITLVDGLPRATVEELRLIFSLNGGAPSLALRGATIDADIGGTIQLFGGFRMLPKDQGVEGFAGDIRLTLSAGFALDGSLLVGINTAEGYPFLYVFVGVELPSGIPLPPSGCALFGFAGLLGLNIAPSRLPGQNWYYDWYRGAPGPGVTQSTKWRPQKDAFALGAGITIGTQDGYTIVVRALLVITLPSFTILIEGRAGFLTERSKLGENPVLRALIVLDPADSILFAIEAQYEFVENVLFAHGVVEGYFPFHSGAWHVYLGEKPANRRIIADVLKKLFRADAYVMIDGTTTEFGGSVGYALDRKFGPVRVKVRAGLSGDGTFSYEPTQLDASLALFGSLRLSAFGVSLGADLDADITVRVPTPFLLSLHFEARLNLCWPLDDIKVEFDVRWEEQLPPPYPTTLLADATALSNVSSDTIALRPGDIAQGVPLDARFALNFGHAISKSAAGAFPRILNFAETFLHRVSPLHTFRYDLASLRLERLDANGGIAETLDLNDSSSPLFGHWQLTPAGQGGGTGSPAPADSSRAPGGTLLLLARTPFEYLQGVWVQGDGTTGPADLPTYEPVPLDPPATKDVDLCVEIGPTVGGGGWLPGDGETASGDPDPAAPTETVTADGTVIVVHGFPEPPAKDWTPGGTRGVTDPTGGAFGIDVSFPEPVVVTDVTISTDPEGDVKVSIDGEPAREPDIPGTSPHRPRTQETEREPIPSGTKPAGRAGVWRCWLLALFGVVLVVTVAVGFGLGWFEPWLRREPLTTIVVVVIATLLILLLWWWACRCGCHAGLVAWWARMRASSDSTPPPLASPALRGGAAALEVVRRYARRLRAAAAAPAGARRVLHRPTYWAPPAALAASAKSAARTAASAASATTGTDSSATAVAATTSSGGAAAAPGTTRGLPRGRVADRVSIRGSKVRCGRVSYVDLDAWRKYAAAVEVNSVRADLRAQYSAIARETLTDDAFLLRPNSHYRLRLSLTKSGRDTSGTEAYDSASTDLEFWTQPAPPTDLRPYVLAPAPQNEDIPLFQAEETGVRMIETYVRQMYERVAGTPLTIRISDTKGVPVGSRRSEWRKAEDHVDRTGQLAYLAQVNAIYGTAVTASALPRDDVLVAVSADESGAGVLPASVTLEAAILASGAGASEDPLYTYRLRTSRYRDLADWAAALPRVAGSLTDPGLPDSLWTGTAPLSISEVTLLPLLKEATPETPLLRRMSRANKPPVLVLTLPEPLPLSRVDFVLWEPVPVQPQPRPNGGVGGGTRVRRR